MMVAPKSTIWMRYKILIICKIGIREHCAQLPKDWSDIQDEFFRLILRKKTERWLKNLKILQTILSFAWWPLQRELKPRSTIAKELGPLAGLQCTPCCSHPSPSTIAWWHINFIMSGQDHISSTMSWTWTLQWMPQDFDTQIHQKLFGF